MTHCRATRPLLRLLALAALVAIGAASACVEAPADGEGGSGKADDVFASGPLYLTGAFDGSKSFRMWLETMEFARSLERDTDKSLRFTYFINSCYYDRTVTGSAIGRGQNDQEVLARWAITQQAINEGHEIANHTVRHLDGGSWSTSRWRDEIGEFHALTERNLFRPVLDDAGAPVFPRFRPVPGAGAGEVGAACASGSECSSGICLPVTPETSVCTARCNRNRPCPAGTACGAPDWNQSTDVCVPIPEFPVVHQGEVLFDDSGHPNLAHPALEPYPIVGFRAPQLAHNTALFEVLTEFDYVYDTSQVLPPGPPARTRHRGRTFETLYQFALMRNPGSLTIPMDYNYFFVDASGERMLRDYRQSILDAYELRQRQPYNIGHHFSLWKGGAYWTAMKEAFLFAARGCPDDGTLRCAEVEFPTFIELAEILDGVRRGAGTDDGRADDLDRDIFADAARDADGDDRDLPAACGCEQGD